MENKIASDKKLYKIPIRIFIAIFFIGMMAKIMQWPYATVLLFVAFLVIATLYSIRFWKKKPKIFLDYIKFILVTFWATNGILEILHFSFSIYFQTISILTFIIWIIMEGAAYFLNEDKKNRKSTFSAILWNSMMVLGTLAVISGAMFKILQWEYALHLLVLGFVFILAYILKDLIVKKVEHESN